MQGEERLRFQNPTDRKARRLGRDVPLQLHSTDDGVRVLRGDVIDTADEPQRGFIEAMARPGAEPAAR